MRKEIVIEIQILLKKRDKATLGRSETDLHYEKNEDGQSDLHSGTVAVLCT
jgi:hypothetical protein